MTNSERRGNERRRRTGYVRPYSRPSAGIVVFPEVDRNAVKVIHARYGPIGLVEFNDGWFSVVRNPEVGKRYHPNHGAMNKFGAERAFNDAVVEYNKYERKSSKERKKTRSKPRLSFLNPHLCIQRLECLTAHGFERSKTDRFW